MHRQMKTTSATLLLALALAISAHAQSPTTHPNPAATVATAPAVTGPRLTRQGSLWWVGASQPDFVALQKELLQTIWNSPAGQRARRDLGLSDATAAESLALHVGGGGGEFRLTLTLPRDTPDARAAGERFLDELTARVIPEALSTWAEHVKRQPLILAEQAVRERRKEWDAATAKAAQQRRAVRDAANVLDPSPDAVRGAASRLDQEKQRITLELAGQAARQKALEERVAKLSDAATARVTKDPIAEELEKIVALRNDEAATSEKMYKTGTMTQAELRAAQARAAEAKARLLERRETVSRSAGTDLLGDLNKELVTLTITIAENEARLRYLDERIAGLSKALELVDDLEQQQAAATRARHQLDEAETQAQSLARQFATAPQPFTISVEWIGPTTQHGRGGGGGGLFGGGNKDAFGGKEDGK